MMSSRSEAKSGSGAVDGPGSRTLRHSEMRLGASEGGTRTATSSFRRSIKVRSPRETRSSNSEKFRAASVALIVEI